MPSRVALTGASGALGRAAREQLERSGCEVWGIDLVPGEPARSFVVDLADYGQTLGILSDLAAGGRPIDAVVHLAAIPASGMVPDATILQSNLRGTLNVLQAVARLGIPSVVLASSMVVLGFPFDTPPPYLPVDEDCDGKPESAYALGKHLEEEAARQFCRWDPRLSITALRFSNLLGPERFASFADHELDRARRRPVLWGYADPRDAARAIVRAVEVRLPGFEALIIAQADTTMSTPTPDLVASEFPGVPVRTPLTGHAGLLSIAKAERLLGWTPRHGWRSEQAVPAP